MNKRLITGITAAMLGAAAIVPVTNNLIASSPARAEEVSAATADETTFLNTAVKQAQKVSKKYGLYHQL